MNYDYYMVAADFDSYAQTQSRMAQLYKDQTEWTRRCIRNIANMGTFSSDRSIHDYATKIWDLQPVPVTLPESDDFPEEIKRKKKK